KHEEIRDLDIPDRFSEAEVECALLDPASKRCSVYTERPVMCRGHTSDNANQCYQNLNDEYQEFPLTFRVADKTLSRIALDGTVAALDQLGLDRPRELTEGLLVALTEPDAMERWLGGEPIFTARRQRS